jgi:hypothetical protein
MREPINTELHLTNLSNINDSNDIGIITTKKTKLKARANRKGNTKINVAGKDQNEATTANL